jgi:hypothetical protein
LRYSAEDNQFTIAGDFDADGSAHAALMARDGDGLDYRQGDAAGHGRFTVPFRVAGGTAEADIVDHLDWRDRPESW